MGIKNPSDLADFFLNNQWKILLLGEKGTGIGMHYDELALSSWQAHVVGRKAWVICPFDQSKLLDFDLHVWEPDYDAHPRFAEAHCGRTIVEPGELLYYPAYWWHSTKFLDTPTIGLAGSMVGVEDDRKDIDV